LANAIVLRACTFDTDAALSGVNRSSQPEIAGGAMPIKETRHAGGFRK
jgi:hypothetical protein